MCCNPSDVKLFSHVFDQLENDQRPRTPQNHARAWSNLRKRQRMKKIS
jgi:hypothetical protein